MPTGDSKPKGPVFKRDIDVEWRTNNIRSDTLVSKEGMKDWKKISEVEELVHILNNANTEVTEEVIKARESIKNMRMPVAASASGASKKKLEPYKTPDGLWHFFDPTVKKWKTSKENPTASVGTKKVEGPGSPVAKPLSGNEPASNSSYIFLYYR